MLARNQEQPHVLELSAGLEIELNLSYVIFRTYWEEYRIPTD